MTSHIINLFKSEFEAIPWIGKFGGLARKVTHLFRIEDKSIEIVYPVGCSTDGDCFNDKSVYTELLPNEKLKSIVYFIQESPTIFQEGISLSADFPHSNISATFKLVVWLNLPKLGYKSQFCDAVSLFSADLIKRIGQMVPDGSFFKFIPKLNVTSQQVNDERLVFSEFLTGIIEENLQLFTTYPYAFFALDINLTATYDAMCFDLLAELSPELCQ